MLQGLPRAIYQQSSDVPLINSCLDYTQIIRHFAEPTDLRFRFHLAATCLADLAKLPNVPSQAKEGVTWLATHMGCAAARDYARVGEPAYFDACDALQGPQNNGPAR